MTRRQLLTAQVGLHQRSFWRNPQAAFFDFAMPGEAKNGAEILSSTGIDALQRPPYGPPPLDGRTRGRVSRNDLRCYNYSWCYNGAGQ